MYFKSCCFRLVVTCRRLFTLTVHTTPAGYLIREEAQINDSLEQIIPVQISSVLVWCLRVGLPLFQKHSSCFDLKRSCCCCYLRFGSMARDKNGFPLSKQFNNRTQERPHSQMSSFVWISSVDPPHWGLYQTLTVSSSFRLLSLSSCHHFTVINTPVYFGGWLALGSWEFSSGDGVRPGWHFDLVALEVSAHRPSMKYQNTVGTAWKTWK